MGNTDRSEKLFFRLHPTVAAQLRQRAESLGLSVSEFLRLAVASALGICIPCNPKDMKTAAKHAHDEVGG